MVVVVMAKNLLFGSNRKNRLETTIWAIQLILLSAGFISTVLVFKTSVIPYSLDIMISTLPGFWVNLKSWLSPPYIYIIINFIIAFIAVSSTLHHPKANVDHLIDDDYGGLRLQHVAEEINHYDFLCNTVADSVVLSEQQQNLPQTNFPEKTKVLFQENQAPDHIKHVLVVEELKNDNNHGDNENNRNGDDDTMEATWKAILEAGKTPAKKELKRLETWNVPPQMETVEMMELKPTTAMRGRKEMRKSDTFNDSTLGTQRGGIMRDLSMSRDEFNRRVEAFISKRNKDMRLQRQESEQRFLAMISS